MRKTINVEKVKNIVNARLLNTPDAYADDRQGHISLLETILMETGNYYGFRYLTEKQMEKSEDGNSFGIGKQREDLSWDFNNTDPTRIQYY